MVGRLHPVSQPTVNLTRRSRSRRRLTLELLEGRCLLDGRGILAAFSTPVFEGLLDESALVSELSDHGERSKLNLSFLPNAGYGALQDAQPAPQHTATGDAQQMPNATIVVKYDLATLQTLALGLRHGQAG